MKPEDTDLCPCCSGKPYGECCKPIMEGEKKAPTAEALMRARYCAYATEHVMFLKESAVKEVQDEFDAEISTNWSRSARCHRLEIVSTEGGGEGDKTGVVELSPAEVFINGRSVSKARKGADATFACEAPVQPGDIVYQLNKI